jgi:hypothetical protein
MNFFAMPACIIFFITLIALCEAQESCALDGSCEGVSVASSATAMLQVRATSQNKTTPTSEVQIIEETLDSDARLRCGDSDMESHLEESRTCLPDGLADKHLKAVRLNAFSKHYSSFRGRNGANETPTSWVGGGDGDTSLPLRLDDVIYLKQKGRDAFLGTCGTYGGGVAAQEGCDAAKHGVYTYAAPETRTEYTVENTHEGTFLKQAGHGTYVGLCGDSAGSCSGSLSYALAFADRGPRTSFKVEQSGGSLYLHHAGTNSYLGVCDTSGTSHADCNGNYDVFGYGSRDAMLLQQGSKQKATTNTRPPHITTYEIQFVSRKAPLHDGSTVQTDAAGFHEITSHCCPPEMEVFFTRLLDSMDMEVCSVPHLQGLMHWFSCVPDMDFAYVLDVINNGSPCKYWTKKGTACPELTPECMGKYCR